MITFQKILVKTNAPTKCRGVMVRSTSACYAAALSGWGTIDITLSVMVLRVYLLESINAVKTCHPPEIQNRFASSYGYRLTILGDSVEMGALKPRPTFSN